MDYRSSPCLTLNAGPKDFKCNPDRLKNLSSSAGSAPVTESSGKKLVLPFLYRRIAGIPFTIFLLLKYEYKSEHSSTSMSQHNTLSGLDAKNPSKTGLIRLHGPHQVAPNLTMISPGLFSRSLKKS